MNRTERRRECARHHHRRDDCRLLELRSKQLSDRRPLERAGGFLRTPGRRVRKKRSDQNERDRGNHTGHQRVAPRFVRSVNRGETGAIRDDEIVRTGDHDAAERSTGLRVADNGFALFRFRKQLRQPGDRCNELHADAHERAAPPDEQPLH